MEKEQLKKNDLPVIKNILHICSIGNNKASGMSNVIPYYYINQKKQKMNIKLTKKYTT